MSAVVGDRMVGGVWMVDAWPLRETVLHVATLERAWRERGLPTPISGDPTWGEPEPVE